MQSGIAQVEALFAETTTDVKALKRNWKASSSTDRFLERSTFSPRCKRRFARLRRPTSFPRRLNRHQPRAAAVLVVDERRLA
jgi:hypothetical protein